METPFSVGGREQDGHKDHRRTITANNPAPDTYALTRRDTKHRTRIPQRQVRRYTHLDLTMVYFSDNSVKQQWYSFRVIRNVRHCCHSLIIHLTTFQFWSQKATLVVVLVVVISSLKIPTAFLIRSAAQQNFAVSPHRSTVSDF